MYCVDAVVEKDSVVVMRASVEDAVDDRELGIVVVEDVVDVVESE